MNIKSSDFENKSLWQSLIQNSCNAKHSNITKMWNIHQTRNKGNIGNQKSNISSIMDTYSELMAKKKSLIKKSQHKVNSKSFISKQKKTSKSK